MHDRDIYIYKLSNRSITKKITIEKEGPNAIKTIEYLLLSYYVLESLFLTDRGIALLNLDKYHDKTENIITFDVLSV